MSKNALRFIAVSLGLLVIGSIAYRIFWTSTILINVKTSPLSTKTQVDGVYVPAGGSGGRTYKVKVGAGKHSIEVATSGYETYAQQISTGFRNTVTIDVSTKKITAEQIAKEIVKNPDTTITGATYFGENDWMVFFAKGGEGSIVVAKHNDNTGKWEVVDEGTDIDTSLEVYTNAPSDLKTYLEKL